MKTLVFYICAFSLVYFTSAKSFQSQPSFNRRLLTSRQDLIECINKTNITTDEMFSVRDILNDRYKEPEHEESVRKHGCIFQCVLEKTGAMEGSEVIVDKMHSEVGMRMAEQSRAKAVRMVNNCIRAIKDVTEKCQKTFDLIACLLKAEFKDLEQISGINEEGTHEVERTSDLT